MLNYRPLYKWEVNQANISQFINTYVCFIKIVSSPIDASLCSFPYHYKSKHL